MPPNPALNEPDKAVCGMAPRPDVDEFRRIDMCLDAGISRIDNVLMKTRRLFSALGRPVGTSSSHHRVWNGYAPCNPAMLEAYVTMFRMAHSFIYVGDDGRTPAMRLGVRRRAAARAVRQGIPCPSLALRLRAGDPVRAPKGPRRATGGAKAEECLGRLAGRRGRR